MSKKQRVKSITVTILTESPIALSNDQGTGTTYTPIKKYSFKDGLHAMTSVGTVTYEIKKKGFTDYNWKLNDLVVKDKNSKFKESEINYLEPDLFGFLIPDKQINKTSPLRIIPFVSINNFKNDTQLITNKGYFDRSLGREYFNEKNEIIQDFDKKTQALANEEIFGDYYYYTITIELDRVGKSEVDSEGKYLLPKDQIYKEAENRKQMIKDLMNIISEFTRDIKHQTIHLKPLVVYGGIFKKTIPYFWNDMKFKEGKLNINVFNRTVEDYNLENEGFLIGAVDKERLSNEIVGNDEKLGDRPILAIKNICKMIEEDKLTIGEDNFWYLEV